MDYNGLIRSIIVQLSDRCSGKISTALVELYHACDDGRSQPLESQLEDTLARILKNFDSSYIIIDSLDGCVEKFDLLRWIQSMTSSDSSKLHLMFTSRPQPELKQGLSSLLNHERIDINNHSNGSDIEAYLDAELAKMHKWTEPSEKEMIKDALLSRSDGMQVFFKSRVGVELRP